MGLKEVFDEIWEKIKNDVKKDDIDWKQEAINYEAKYREMIKKWLDALDRIRELEDENRELRKRLVVCETLKELCIFQKFLEKSWGRINTQ